MSFMKEKLKKMMIEKIMFEQVIKVSGEFEVWFEMEKKIEVGILLFMKGERMQREEVIEGINKWKMNVKVIEQKLVMFKIMGIEDGWEIKGI